jgi:hypothetical protein
MTTESQLISFDESDDVDDEGAALEILRCNPEGLTADESFEIANPGTDFPHGPVDSWRVALRHLREKGLVCDSGEKRRSPDTDRLQTVWTMGDDRWLVEDHRRRKLRKFPIEWLQDELERRSREAGV